MDRRVRSGDVSGLPVVHAILRLYALFSEDLLVRGAISVAAVVGFSAEQEENEGR